MKEYFSFRETSNNGWTICPKHELFGMPKITGSYALIAARMMGLSWPDWLLYCKQNGASLYGKGNIYVIPVWKEPNKDILNKLNKRTNEIAKKIDITSLKY